MTPCEAVSWIGEQLAQGRSVDLIQRSSDRVVARLLPPRGSASVVPQFLTLPIAYGLGESVVAAIESLRADLEAPART
jgi:hypothetical protein